MSAHHPRERALVGERERLIPERMGPGDELLGVRGAAQEGEVAETVQLGVGRGHGPAPSIMGLM